MTVHYYFMPITRVTVDDETSRGPKYLLSRRNPTGIDCRWSMIDYGLIDLAFVAADTALSQHQQIFDQTDTLSVDPRNGNSRDLDATATQAEIDALTAHLDTAGNFVPMNWAAITDTRRAILRGICGIFLFMQRVTATIGTPPTEWGITLATTWAALAVDKQDAMRDAAVSLDITHADPADTMTMRALLRFMGNTLSSRPVSLGFAGDI